MFYIYTNNIERSNYEQIHMSLLAPYDLVYIYIHTQLRNVCFPIIKQDLELKSRLMGPLKNYCSNNTAC
jgi:hypothetical protein